MRFDERSVVRWMATHHSVVTRSRARRLGMTEAMIDRRVASGRWIVLHKGVYADAASVSTPMRALVAAMAAVGPGCMATHLSAAWLLGLIPDPPPVPVVLAPPGRQCRASGLRIIRSRDQAPCVVRHGLPCTAVVRTLVDCAAILPPRALADLVDAALATRAVDLPKLVQALQPGSGPDRRRGRVSLRRTLTARGYLGGPAPSALESRMARLIAGLGLPGVQAEVRWVTGRNGGREYRLDFAWPDRCLAVEVDGYVWHSSPERMGRDQRRRNLLTQAGWIVLVYTWRDVVDDAERVAREISETYRRRG